MGRYTVHTATGPKRRVVKAVADRDQGLVFQGEKQKLSTFLDRWLNSSVKSSVKPSTFESYERMIRNHIRPAVGHKKLKVLAPDHVQ